MPTRSYAAWCARLRSAVARWPSLRLETLGLVGPANDPLPLFRVIDTRERAGRRSVVLTGGMHGDEPAGVEALTRLLEHPDRWSDELAAFHVMIFPCANPTGFERGTRENFLGIDLNRAFDGPAPPTEVSLMRPHLDARHGHRPFDLSVDLHEDVDNDGFYLYELRRDAAPIGVTIVEAVQSMVRINRAGTIEGLAASGGIISPDPEELQRHHPARWPQAIYSFWAGTPSCLTLETPAVGVAIDRRADVHLIALHAAFTVIGPSAGADPNIAKVRPAEVVERYEQ